MWKEFMMETFLLVAVILLILLMFVVIGVVGFLIFSTLSISERLRKVEDNLIDAIKDANTFRPPRMETDMESEVASGLVMGLRQMRDDDERHQKLLELARQQARQPVPVLNQNSAAQEIIDTKGELIPANLTEHEREVLKAYYGTKE